MKKEILDQTENKEIPALRILTKRQGNKLLVANAGCGVLIGIIEQIDNEYFIDSCINSFRSERDAVDYLIC